MENRKQSVSPTGEVFPLPTEAEAEREYEELAARAIEERARGREIVCVVGLGFVGAVMAAVVADADDRRTGKPGKFVIGVQRPSPRSYWKIPLLNRGVSPVKAEDPEVDRLIRRCVQEKQDPGGHLPWRGAEAGRRGGGGRAVRLLKKSLGNVRTGTRGHGGPGGHLPHDRPERPARRRWS